MPPVGEVAPRAGGELAIAVEGDLHARPGGYGLPPVAKLPPLHAWAGADSATRWFEVFNRGTAPVRFTVEAREPWLRVSVREGEAGPADVRVEVSADWPAVPEGAHTGRITVRAAGENRGGLRIDVPVIKPDIRDATSMAGAFVELDRQLAIEAPHFSDSTAGEGASWQVLDNHGRTLGGVTIFPVTHPSVQKPDGDSARLEYPLWLESVGEARLRLVASPTLDYVPGRGLRVAVSLDDEAPRIIDLLADRSGAAWERMVSDGVNQVTTKLRVAEPGRHTLKVWLVDPGVVLQRLVLDFGGAKPTYLGPRESPRAP